MGADARTFSSATFGQGRTDPEGRSPSHRATRIVLLGLLLRPWLEPLVGPALYLGVLFICALPSTVQSSIAFTSMARRRTESRRSARRRGGPSRCAHWLA